MLRDDSSESELRIRLEGRVEQVELLLARWDDVHDALRGSGWSIDESRLEIETSAGDQQALVRVSESPAGRRLVRQLETSLKRTNALAAKMLRELALPVLPGANALADLRSHLPLRYKTESASAPMAVAVAAGGAAIVVGLAVASWSGDAGGLGCLALFGLVFAVAFSAAWAKRESFVVITQRMLAVRSIAIPLSEIVSVHIFF